MILSPFSAIPYQEFCTLKNNSPFLILILIFHSSGILVDSSEGELLVHKCHSNRAFSESFSESVGHFSSVALPQSLMEDWRAMMISQKVNEGLLVASSTTENARGHNVYTSALTSKGGGMSGSAGKGYLAVIMSSGSRDRGAPCLWLFNMLTRRWRSNDLTLKANEFQAAIVSAKSGDADYSKVERQMSGGSLSTEGKRDWRRLSAFSVDDSESDYLPSVDIHKSRMKQGSVSPVPQSPSSSASIPSIRMLSLSWFGDHSLVILGQKEKELSTDTSNLSYYLELVSRAPTRESLRFGKPQPAVHRILPLPFPHHGTSPPISFLESHCSHTSEGRGSYKDNCAVIVGDGWRFVGYNVQAVFSSSSSTDREVEVLNYEFSFLWDINLSSLIYQPIISHVTGSGAGLGAHAAGKGEKEREENNVSMILPISSLNILTTNSNDNHSNSTKSSVSFIVIDSIGGAWLIDPKGKRETGRPSRSLINKGPFSAMRRCDAVSLFQRSATISGYSDIDSGPLHSLNPLVMVMFVHSDEVKHTPQDKYSSLISDFLWIWIDIIERSSSDEDSSKSHLLSTPTSFSTPISLLLPVLEPKASLSVSKPPAKTNPKWVVNGSVLTMQSPSTSLSLSPPLPSPIHDPSHASRASLVDLAKGVTVEGTSLGLVLILSLLDVIHGRCHSYDTQSQINDSADTLDSINIKSPRLSISHPNDPTPNHQHIKDVTTITACLLQDLMETMQEQSSHPRYKIMRFLDP